MNKAQEYSSNIIDDLLADITPQDIEKRAKKLLLATRIAEAIQKKGWSKKEFAQRINRKPSEISRWLSGSNNFTVDTLLEIEELLCISLLHVEEGVLEPKTRKTVKYNLVIAAVNRNKSANNNIVPYGSNWNFVPPLAQC
jgi:transcriptional regulator with XRE-family HTH domain